MKFFVAILDLKAIVIKEFETREKMLAFVLTLKTSGRERDILCIWTEVL